VQALLYTIQSTIQLASPWTIPTIRHNDIHLMNAFNDAGYSKPKLQILNHCQLALQVTTLAEITDHTGCRLLQEALLNGPTTPSLIMVSTSNHNWPQQPSPSQHGHFGTKHFKQCSPNQAYPINSGTPSAHGPLMQNLLRLGMQHSIQTPPKSTNTFHLNLLNATSCIKQPDPTTSTNNHSLPIPPSTP